MKRKKTAYESREWKASDGAYGKADSVSPFACFSIVLIVGILIFGVVKVAPKIMAWGGGHDYRNNQYYSSYVSVFHDAVRMQECDVCFVGDSLTARGLWSEFFPDLQVANRGIGSDTSEGVLNRLDTVVELDPDCVLLMIGVNDLGHAFSADEISTNVEAIVDQLHSKLPDSKIVLQGVLPAEGLSETDILNLNKLYADLAAKRDFVAYIDLHDRFLGSNGDRNSSLYASDGVHLMGSGYQIWVDAIEPYLS